MKDWTLKHIEKLKEEKKIVDYTIINQKSDVIADMIKQVKQGGKVRLSKYGATKTVVDGITFDSAKEAGRYSRLKMLEGAKLIKDLQLQVPYELNEGGTHSLKYIADFEYFDVMTGQKVTEDTKGFKTVEYKKKRKLMLKIHGIKIFES